MPILRTMRRHTRTRRAALLAAAAALLACPWPASAAEEGLASWYGGKFQGRTTSSGEIFDTNLMTAAHKSLPFGTVVRVTDLDTGSSTVVRINDRGPFVEGRIIDLSRAAAEQLGIVGRGVARVAVEVVDLAASRPVFAIQVGSFGLETNARRALAVLEQAGFVATLEKTAAGATRVLARGIAQKDLAGAQKKLEELGFARVLVREDGPGMPQ